MTTPKAKLAGLALIAALCTGFTLGLMAPAWASFIEGWLAYDRGDYAAALREWRPLAEQGDAGAQYYLGVMYYNKGRGVPQDYARALQWWRKAAEQGYAEAQYSLGITYATGRGVPQDYPRAAKWYRKAAEQGYAQAQYILGDMYVVGQGVPQDYAEAAKWYRKAAEQGYAKAQYVLGLMYGNGEGVPQDYVRAHMWSNLAAAQGDKTATMFRDLTARVMTPTQLAEAQRLAREWRPRKQVAATSSMPDAGGATDNRRRIAGIQRGLASLGYDPGPTDGILGPKTRDAIRVFQAREGLPVTGMVSVSLVAALRSASGAGGRGREEKNAAIADQEVTVEQAADIFERGCVGMSEAIGGEVGGSGVKVQEAIRICLLGTAESVERDLKAAKVSAQVRAKHEAVIREIRRRASTR